MNNHVFVIGKVVRKSLFEINGRDILNVTVCSTSIINGKEIPAYIPVQISIPNMVVQYKDIAIGTMVSVEGRFETYKTNSNKNGYHVTQLTSFRPFDQGNYNHASIWGRITSDIHIATTQNGNKVTSFSIANSRGYKRGEEWVEITSFIPVVAWGDAADMASSFQKGQAVWVEGKLSSRSYENKEGVKVYITEVNADCVLDGGSGKKNIVLDDNGNKTQPQPVQNKTQNIPNNQGVRGLPSFPGVPSSFDGKPRTTSYPASPFNDDFMNIPDMDEDLPF